MRLENIKISGFRAIPFCAQFRESPNQVLWNNCAFQITCSISKPLLYAIIGPNSCGKSSVLYALQYFFSSTTKLANEELYNNKDNSQPIIIEVTLVGDVPNPDSWIGDHCACDEGKYRLTLLSVTTPESRSNFIRKPDGELKKQTSADKEKINALAPKFRLISADGKLSDEVNPEKKNLATDLIDELIYAAPATSNRSVLQEIQKTIIQLDQLVRREEANNSYDWKEIEDLENLLSSGLSDLTPGKPKVRFSMMENIPTLESIFNKGKFRVVDGIEIGIEGHGLGLQRTFLISILNAWANTIGHKDDNQDYIFAVEEPELYLHPHAIRVLLSTLEDIANRDQVIFTSHVCEFVNSVPLKNVIKIQRIVNDRTIIQPNLDKLPAKEITKVQRYLREDRSDMLFARAVLLVEGQSELFALPSFAKKLGVDFNKNGVSLIVSNGKTNFDPYHQILKAFGIPHVILADGDGHKKSEQKKQNQSSNYAVVLDEDFEYLVASVLSEDRLLEVINHCKTLQGEKTISALDTTGITAQNLLSGWWNHLKKDMHADISSEFRNNYSPQQAQIKTILEQIANSVSANGHLLSSATIKRRAGLLKEESKPLVGRALGELVTESEVLAMTEICEAIHKVVELAC